MVDCVNIVLQKSPLWTGFLFSYLQVCPQNIVSLLVNRRDPCSFYFLFFHKGGWLIFGETLSFLRIRLGLGGGVKLLSRVWLFVTPWMAACQASLSITNSQSLLRHTSIESVMPSNHLIPCRLLLLLPSVVPSIQGLFQWVGSSYQVARVSKLFFFKLSP